MSKIVQGTNWQTAIRASDLIAGAIADAAVEGREIASKKKPAKPESDDS